MRPAMCVPRMVPIRLRGTHGLFAPTRTPPHAAATRCRISSQLRSDKNIPISSRSRAEAIGACKNPGSAAEEAPTGDPVETRSRDSRNSTSRASQPFPPTSGQTGPPQVPGRLHHAAWDWPTFQRPMPAQTNPASATVANNLNLYAFNLPIFIRPCPAES